MSEQMRPREEEARRELDEIIRLRKNWSFNLEVDDAIEVIFAWHPRHAPQPPTRENLSRICHLNLDKCVIGAFGELSSTGYAYIENCVDDLLALFSQGSGPKEWCPHVNQEGTFFSCDHGQQGHQEKVCVTWNHCPICGAKRPEGGDGQ